MNPFDPKNLRLCVDVVIFTLREGQLQVLLVQNMPGAGDKHIDSWVLPGKELEADEALEAAAYKAVEEWVGVRETYLEQLYTFGELDRDPKRRVISIVYYTLIPTDARIKPFQHDPEIKARWFNVNELPKLAFDHAAILKYGLRRLRYKLEYSAVGFQLLPEEFTLSEIQQTYETILGEKLDKRNFRRRILDARIIEALPRRRIGEGRPARLYRYREDAVAEVKARRLFP
jgi:8-oxo-dGTP diphosphatase